MFVSLWVRNKNKSGTTSMPKYVPICNKFGTHVHWYGPLRDFFFKILIFIDFIGFFLYFWALSIFQVEIEFLWVLSGKWLILRLVYWGACCAKMCIFRDNTLFYGFVGPSQFLQVKSRHWPNRFFMLFIGCIAHSIKSIIALSSLAYWIAQLSR